MTLSAGAIALVGSGEYLPQAQALESELVRLAISRGKSNTFIQIPTAAGKEGSESLDKSVQAMAEKSNKEEDVITETMAEVFLQQGKLHKAKEIYEKLSLLNPSKIAYFAAKIEQIQ